MMKSIIINKYKLYFKLLGIFVLFSLFLWNTLKVNAKLNTIEIILNCYEENSLEYKKTELEAQNNILMKADNEKVLNRYKKQMEDAYGDTLDNLKIAYEESLLQFNIYTFFEENNEQWIDEQNRLKKFKFLKDYFQVPVQEAKISYSETKLNELDDTFRIVQAKYKLGYATKLEIDTAKLNISNEESNLKDYKEQYEILKLKLCCDLGKQTIESYQIYEFNEVKTQQEYIQEYNNDNLTLNYLEKQKNAYEIYKDDMKLKGSGYEIYEEKADTQIKLLDIKIEQYNANLPVYLTGLIDSFYSELEKLNAKKEALANLELKITNYSKLYKKGKVQKLEITKLKTKEAELNYDITNSLYNLNINYYKLYFNIYE